MDQIIIVLQLGARQNIWQPEVYTEHESRAPAVRCSFVGGRKATLTQQATMADVNADYIANSADPKNVQDLTTFVSISTNR